MTERNTVHLISIGRHGWSQHYDGTWGPNGEHHHTGTVSGYPGHDWTKAGERDVIADDVPVVVTATIPEDSADGRDIVTFAIAGPMVSVTLPAGMVSQVMGPTVPWSDSPDASAKYPYFGNARSLDYVAVDVYCQLARQFGAIVTTFADAVSRKDEFDHIVQEA